MGEHVETDRVCHDVSCIVGTTCWCRRDPRHDGSNPMDLDLQPGKSAESLQRASAGWVRSNDH